MTHDTPPQPLYLGAAGFTQQAPRAPLSQLPPLSLYIHIPWCVRKCPYCDFNSHTASPVLPEDEYVDALLADLDQDLHAVYGRELSSIFFGGGTPSLFSAHALGRLLKGVEARIPFASDIEITLEANPGTFEQEKFVAYRKLGINRLSIGIQSFQQEKLQALGRIHNGDEAVRAASMARLAGFDNFNLDLMHGLPDQSLEDALSDLRQAIALKPTHLSWYQLTLEPNTVFWNQPPCCRKTTPCGTFRKPVKRCSPSTATPSTKCRPTPSPAGRRGTISITGVSATLSASALAPTAN
jgi:putative oxygen-independent coproporphyrinogen III oxidase